MARRNRRTTRPARRDSAPERRAVTTETARQPAREPARESARSRTRSRLARSGEPEATGAPSPALERAAALERGHVVKDSRRLAITVGVMLALLVVSGFVVNALFP